MKLSFLLLALGKYTLSWSWWCTSSLKLIFVSTVGLVVATSNNQPQQKQPKEASPWKLNQEYRYDIKARTLTGIPDLKDQYVGIQTKGQLVMQVKSQYQLVGQLNHVQNAHFHQELSEGWYQEIPQDQLSYKESSINNKRFLINYSRGAIQNITVPTSMTNEEVNQLKAILSQLQIDASGKRAISCRHNEFPELTNPKPTGSYKVMEPSVTGECETHYSVSPLPDYINAYQAQEEQDESIKVQGKLIEIVKTMNYSNCDTRSGFHYGITGDSDFKPNTNQMGDFLSVSILKVFLKEKLKSYKFYRNPLLARSSLPVHCPTQ